MTMFKGFLKWFLGDSATKEAEPTPQYLTGNQTVKPKAAPKPKAKPVEKKPAITQEELKKMTKKQIDDWAAGAGVTLDRRLTKDKMIAELKNHVSVK